MIILSGTFWDDWLSYFKDLPTKNLEGIESGRPYYSAVIEMVWNLPWYGYRKLSFITYWIISILFYIIMRNLKIIDEYGCLCIAILYIVIPVNDARVLLANYPYALGLLFFVIACYIMTKFECVFPQLLHRIIALLFFFLSFTLNSNLVIYGFIILYIVIKTGKRFYVYFDFLLLPFVFYFLNTRFFPVYGAYKNYNIVTISRVQNAIITLPQMTIDLISMIFKNWSQNTFVNWIGIILCILGIMIQYKKTSESGITDGQRAWLLIVGIMLMAAGLFPYIVVRNHNISTTGIEGRDSILIAFGLSILLFSVFDNKKFRKSFMVIPVLCGIVFFNMQYLLYQREWYVQLAFQNIISNEDLNGGVYIVNATPASSIGDRRFYTWSGNAASVRDHYDLFLLNGEGDRNYVENPQLLNSILIHYPMFRDFNSEDIEIKGIIDFKAEIPLQRTIKLKIMELFMVEKFERRISQIVE